MADVSLHPFPAPVAPYHFTGTRNDPAWYRFVAGLHARCRSKIYALEDAGRWCDANVHQAELVQLEKELERLEGRIRPNSFRRS